jgi:hypothetical protein
VTFFGRPPWVGSSGQKPLSWGPGGAHPGTFDGRKTPNARSKPAVWFARQPLLTCKGDIHAKSEPC